MLHPYKRRNKQTNKSNGILPFATALTDLEGIMLNEVRQRKTNAIRFHLCMQSEKQNKQKETDSDTGANCSVIARGEEGRGN